MEGFDWRYFLRHYGLATGIKAAIFGPYCSLRKALIDPSQESIVHTQSGDLKTISNDLGISQELRISKVHEPLVTEILKNELKAGMICIDIGANIGYYTLLERKIAGRGAVLAIEPSPKSISNLKTNLELNNFLDVPIFPFALSDADGSVDFLVAGESNASHVVEGNVAEGGIIKVDSKKLDTFVKENQIENCDFLRMDVEGHELAIYSGGREAIRRMKPYLLIEIHKRLLGKDDTLNLLLQMKEDGYDVDYFIPREVDFGWLASKHHVERLSICEVIERVRDRRAQDCFHLFLANKQRSSKVSAPANRPPLVNVTSTSRP